MPAYFLPFPTFIAFPPERTIIFTAVRLKSFAYTSSGLSIIPLASTFIYAASCAISPFFFKMFISILSPAIKLRESVSTFITVLPLPSVNIHISLRIRSFAKESEIALSAYIASITLTAELSASALAIIPSVFSSPNSTHSFSSAPNPLSEISMFSCSYLFFSVSISGIELIKGSLFEKTVI